jgi:uncharacterized protein (TIRG00374 family)
MNLRGLAQMTFGVVALAVVIMKSDLRGLGDVLRSARLAYLPLAVLASFTVTWLMAARWGAILRVRGAQIKTSRLFAYYLIGIFFMNFVPGGGISGDVARLIYVDRDIRDKAFVLSTLVFERLVGLFTVLLSWLIATLVSHAYVPSDPGIITGEIVLGLAFIASALLLSNTVSTWLARWCRHLGARFKVERIGAAAARTLEAITELRTHRAMLARTLALSIPVRLVWGLGCYAVAVALRLPLSYAMVLAFISLVDLIRMLPISVGGLGVREWLLIALFASVGIGREQALAFALLAFAPIYLNAIAGGIIYVSMARLRRSQERINNLRGSERVF